MIVMAVAAALVSTLVQGPAPAKASSIPCLGLILS